MPPGLAPVIGLDVYTIVIDGTQILAGVALVICAVWFCCVRRMQGGGTLPRVGVNNTGEFVVTQPAEKMLAIM